MQIPVDHSRLREELRRKLNVQLERVLTHGAPIDSHTKHRRRTRIFKAVAHALLYTAQAWGVAHEELIATLEGRPREKSQSVSMTEKTRTVQLVRLGLERITEHERQRVNEVARLLYQATFGAPASVVVDLFARFLMENGPDIGLERAVVLQRVTNLDLMQRAHGRPQQYIPVEQYNL